MQNIKGLYAIVDTTFSPQYSHEELAHLILLGGGKILQLRVKSPLKNPLTPALSQRERGNSPTWYDKAFEAARRIMALKKKFDFTFIINDHIEIAGELGADGVHIGANDLPIEEVRRMLGSKAIIGYSSHSCDEALAAEQRGADYLAFGAIFPTKTKGPLHPVQGLKALRELKSDLKVPLVAIGGINRTNVESVIATGVDSVAMITGITEAKDVVEEVRWYAGRFT